MSDAMRADYAMRAAADMSGVVATNDERVTTRIRQRAQKHVAEINEIALGIEQLANQLFGVPPPPPNAPPPQAAETGRLEPIRPQMDAIDQAQYLIDEALETLRRQASRLAAL
jgi:hypothetical protein